MKTILVCTLLSLCAWGSAQEPTAILKTSGLVSDVVVREGKIVVATDGGGVDIFDVKTRKKASNISVPLLSDINGKKIIPKIYSADSIGDQTVMVSESGKEFRNVYLYDGKKLTNVVDSSRKLLIKKVRFVDATHLLFGLSGDTLVLMNIPDKRLVYQIQIGQGVFRDMALSDSKKIVAATDEGGEIAMFETNSGKWIKTLKGINVDNINRIDYKHNTIISAGQDRRVGIYQRSGSYFLESDFFIYAVGLSPSAVQGVYVDGTENELQLFNIQTKQKGARLRAGEAVPDSLIFINEKELISAGEENQIYYWRLP
ncbi:WD40 repeat domain-containing protein [Sulfuricurvum sp.]|uniref:WD40 repeat domain-containing protein n=1 Tax=Sulfuricurvum sp. TaxID=2025608 RepID=UPI003568AECD